MEDVTKWVDEGSSVDIINLDSKKAFDKVPHQRLLFKQKVIILGSVNTGHGNEDAQYIMGGTVLNTTVKDIGLTISVDMKVSE